MSKKKWIIITTIMMTMLLGIAGCGKNTDDKEGADVSAVTAEDLPGSKEVDGDEAEKNLYGDIWEIGEGQFTVTEIYVETEEDGGGIMAAPAEDTAGNVPKITVVYDDDTRFVKKKIWDGGANYEEKEGSAADLKKGFTAEMNGSYEGDVFHAAEILIVEVILN